MRGGDGAAGGGGGGGRLTDVDLVGGGRGGCEKSEDW